MKRGDSLVTGLFIIGLVFLSGVLTYNAQITGYNGISTQSTGTIIPVTGCMDLTTQLHGSIQT